MKIRLYALVMTTMMLFVPILSVNASPSPKLPCDSVIRFPDLNFEEAVREIIDKPIGDITANDVAGITQLLIIGLDITDLTGIEYFSALEELSCQENQLTELDVSLNTMLTMLECDMNLLTTLDVSRNQKLETLTCGNNQLTMLDVSHNPALMWLDCYGNQLKTLDVGQNPALENLLCDSNQLIALDVSKNLALVELICRNNLFPDKSAIVGLDESRLTQFIFDPQGDL